MAALQEYVDPDATGAGNGNSPTDAYTALTTWESTEQQDLTDGGGDTMTCTCLDSSGTADTTAIEIAGWTTGATNYILIEAAATDRAEAASWNASKYRLSVANSDVFRIGGAGHVRIDGLQIELSSANAAFEIVYILNTIAVGSDFRISNCRIRGPDNDTYASYGIRTLDTDITLKVWNTLIYNIGQNAASYGMRIYTGTTDVFNIVVYNCYNGVLQQAGTTTIKNGAVFESNDDFNGIITIDYCASDDNDGTNNVTESGGGAAWPDDFVDAANGDFTLKSGSGLVGGGIDNPGSGLYSDDINGDARTSPWDVGADEYIAAVGGIAVLRRRRSA